MNGPFPIVLVGGGIGGSATALRAAQHTLRTARIRGDRATAKASRAKYVYNVDNMLGVHSGIVRRKVIYTAQEYAVRAVNAIDGRLRRARREAILRRHGG